MAIADHAEGCVLRVRAQPGARNNRIVGWHGGALKVAVTAPPEAGKANQALANLLCDQLGRKRAQVELLSGAGSRDKRFLIRGLSRTELERKLAALVGDES
jgi:uncharacterized protein (TIGR00251 family)